MNDLTQHPVYAALSERTRQIIANGPNGSGDMTPDEMADDLEVCDTCGTSRYLMDPYCAPCENAKATDPTKCQPCATLDCDNLEAPYADGYCHDCATERNYHERDLRDLRNI